MGFLSFAFNAATVVLLMVGVLVLGVVLFGVREVLAGWMGTSRAADRFRKVTSYFTWGTCIAALVGGFVLYVTRAPDKAELERGMAKLFTYPSNRIRIDLNAVSDAQRQELVRALQPLLKSTSREFYQRVTTRRGGYDVEATLPSYYRLTTDRLEIATGESFGNGRTIPVLFPQVLAHAANAATVPALPAAIDAQIVAGDQAPVPLSLVSKTAELMVLTRQTLRGTQPLPAPCLMAIQTQVPTDHFEWLFGADRNGLGKDVRLQVNAVPGVLPAGTYELRQLTLLGSERKRVLWERAAAQGHVSVQLGLAPVGLRESPGCEARLLKQLDRAWTVTALRNVSPALATAVKQVDIEQRPARFSPWYAGFGWVAAQP